MPVAESIDGFVAQEAPVAESINGYVGNSCFEQTEERKMAFTAILQMSVDDVDAAMKMAQAINRKAGGYTQEVDNFQTTLKVPQGKADEVLE